MEVSNFNSTRIAVVGISLTEAFCLLFLILISGSISNQTKAKSQCQSSNQKSDSHLKKNEWTSVSSLYWITKSPISTLSLSSTSWANSVTFANGSEGMIQSPFSSKELTQLPMNFIISQQQSNKQPRKEHPIMLKNCCGHQHNLGHHLQSRKVQYTRENRVLQTRIER